MRLLQRCAGYFKGKGVDDARLVMTLLTRDEADVIKYNIEHHLNQGVDFIVATDNGSDDGTREILEEYGKRGALHLIDEKGRAFSQAEWVNRMGKMAYGRFRADIIFHCDADEFWYSRSGNLKKEILAVKWGFFDRSKHALNVNIVNVLLEDKGGLEKFPDDATCAIIRPTVADNYEEDTKRTNLYLFRYPPKVIFRTDKGFLKVTAGNHSIEDVPSDRVRASRDISIFHYPLRSKEHFYRKTINGGRSIESNKKLAKKAGWHWRRWYESYTRGSLDEEYKKLILKSEDIARLKEDGSLCELDFFDILDNSVVMEKKAPHFFKESALAHKYCSGKGLEIGGSAHNPFGLDTLNVDYTDSMETVFKANEIKLCGKARKVDIVANGDDIPLQDASQDFILSSHVFEHLPNPIKGLMEWDRLVKPGGVIFMIVPHKERTFDKGRERTPLAHLIEDFEKDEKEIVEDGQGHHHVWVTEDVVELVNYMICKMGRKWELVEARDVDDKVGNGFTVVIRKLS